MLQRAASNAYTWWWASHIRTKQSKWLDNNLQDMEERVKSMLNLIEEDADTFAKKAEMYYKRRPELITFVQEVYKSYRALAERYDHLSGELHKANNTIATVFPDQVHFGIDEEEDEISPKPSPVHSNSSKVHKVSRSLDEYSLATTRSLKLPPVQKSPEHKRTASFVVSKEKAQEEIDRLQKRILALQTEKEFVKSSYETGVAKYWGIERQITEMQERVCKLQDDFSAAETVIEDDEARALMAVTALKSCEDTLVDLHEKQRRSSEESRVESRRIKNARRKLRALKCQYGYLEAEGLDSADMTGESSADEYASTLSDAACGLMSHERLELQTVCEKVRRHFQMNSELSVMELAEKIDVLVSKVIALESTVSSQEAQIERLRLENDELQKQVQALEEEKMSLIDGSEDLSDRLRQAEEQLRGLQELDRSVRDEGGKLQAHFSEACETFTDLSDRLQSPDEADQAERSQPEPSPTDGKPSPTDGGAAVTPQVSAGNRQQQDPETRQAKDSSTAGNEEEKGVEQQESPLHNWQQLFLLDELEDREKILLAEYMSILRNYKDAKRRLTESEERNQSQLFETMAQMRDLRSLVVMKDEEIRSLRQKLSFVEPGWNGNSNPTSSNPEIPRTGCDRTLGSLFEDDKTSARGGGRGGSFWADDQRSGGSITEERFRRDLDELLSENLEFWLRFSSSVQQIQAYQATSDDLQGKIARLRNRRRGESGSGSSKQQQAAAKDEATSIYKQLKELQADLAVWIEQNAILKEELRGRFASLCGIREELARVASGGGAGDDDDVGFTAYQAAKFQGEVINMQQENNRVANELQTGLDHVREIQHEVGRALSRLSESFDLRSSTSKALHQYHFRNFSTRSRIPLRNFLFGAKPKKPSIFSCMNPAFQKQYSDLRSFPHHH